MRNVRVLLILVLLVIVLIPSIAEASRQIFYHVLGSKKANPIGKADWVDYGTIEATNLSDQQTKQAVDKAVQRAYADGAKRVKIQRQVFLSPTKAQPIEDVGEAAPGQGLPLELFQVPGTSAEPAKKPVDTPPTEEQALERLREILKRARDATTFLTNRKEAVDDARLKTANGLITDYNKRFDDFIKVYKKAPPDMSALSLLKSLQDRIDRINEANAKFEMKCKELDARADALEKKGAAFDRKPPKDRTAQERQAIVNAVNQFNADSDAAVEQFKKALDAIARSAKSDLADPTFVSKQAYNEAMEKARKKLN